MEFETFYVKKGLLYIQMFNLRLGEDIFVEHDEVAVRWRICAAKLIIKNNKDFICEHCGLRFRATDPSEVTTWIYYEVCERCKLKSEVYAIDKPCVVEKIFLRKGGKVPNADISIEDMYNITLN